MTGSLNNRMNRAGQSVSQLMEGLNVTGKANTEKPLYRSEPLPNMGIKAIHFEVHEREYAEALEENGGDQSRGRSENKARKPKAGKAEAAPIEINIEDITGPKEFILSGTSDTFSNRIDTNVIAAIKAMHGKPAKHVERALIEYALKYSSP